MERLMKVLCVLVVIACVAPAMAQVTCSWYGAAGADFFTDTNWSPDPTVEGQSTTWLDMNGTGSTSATITSDNSWVAGWRNKYVNVTQTDGTAELINGQDSWPGLLMFNTLSFNISGDASFTEWGQTILGASAWGGAAKGSTWFNLSDSASLTFMRPQYTTIAKTGLYIASSSGISLSGDATVTIDNSMADVAALISGGMIKGANGETLTTTTITKSVTLYNPSITPGDPGSEIPTDIECTVVSIIPEPATMVLLGLGTLVLRRKR